MPAELTQQYLQSILNYDPKTGIFVWKKRSDVSEAWNTKYAGKEAGRVARNGYREIIIWKKHYQASRIAWLYVTGEWPSLDIDHKDNIRINNVFSNLRQATNTENLRNRKKQKNNKSGYKGVFYNKYNKNWTASINVSRKKSKFLGAFKTAEEAHSAYCQAANKYHGEFARTA